MRASKFVCWAIQMLLLHHGVVFFWNGRHRGDIGVVLVVCAAHGSLRWHEFRIVLTLIWRVGVAYDLVTHPSSRLAFISTHPSHFDTAQAIVRRARLNFDHLALRHDLTWVASEDLAIISARACNWRIVSLWTTAPVFRHVVRVWLQIAEVTAGKATIHTRNVIITQLDYGGFGAVAPLACRKRGNITIIILAAAFALRKVGRLQFVLVSDAWFRLQALLGRSVLGAIELANRCDLAPRFFLLLILRMKWYLIVLFS